ncbi:type VII secretion integral membrane protein EccD [Mycolicibacterium iranicum]|uniref:type VII secretion integral membrane protein EccD n=1 Tax=Mycolicibacterium iranicum TaxID=912594 RepID=UPI0021A5C223|nr:type VII secretion integral membrane protein EccD [Mycolicibacterium iranicum]
MCRVSVDVTGADQCATVDLVLPADRPVGELMPSLVDTIFGDTAGQQWWFLTRLAGSPLNSALSLRDNAIRDGDVVVLASRPVPRPRLTPADPSGVVAAQCAGPDDAASRRIVAAVATAGCAASAVIMAWSGLTEEGSRHLWSAAVLGAAAAAASVSAGRTDRDLSLVLSAAALVFGTAAAILATAGAPWPAATLLAACSALATCTVLTKLGVGNAALTASAAAAAAVAAAAALSVAVAVDVGAAAVVLAVLSVAALSAAPRLTILLTRLGPAQPEVDGSRAELAHNTLTALMAGWCASTALGTVVVAAAAVGQRHPALLDAALCADLGALLMLRLRCHADARRRTLLAAAGSVALGAALVAGVAAAPAQGYWICTVAAAVSIAAAWWGHRARTPGPMAANTFQLAEYAVLVAVFPLAFWTTGLYGFVRDLSLS